MLLRMLAAGRGSFFLRHDLMTLRGLRMMRAGFGLALVIGSGRVAMALGGIVVMLSSFGVMFAGHSIIL